MRCYGHCYGRLEQCGTCSEAKYCRDAGDPFLLSERVPRRCDAEVLASAERQSAEGVWSKIDGGDAEEHYSRDDLLEVIGFMVALDDTTLEYLAQKLGNPDITFTEMSRRRNVTRQAVHKLIKKKCEKNPELALVMRNRSHRKFIKNQSSFMEEVWKIRKKAREWQSSKPKPASNYLRKLICSNRNLDLSRMSILKGAALWNRV